MATAIAAMILVGILLAAGTYIVRVASDMTSRLQPGVTHTGGRCPFCGKGRKAGATVCHHCGRRTA